MRSGGSRERNGLALAAIAVTGVVGVAGPLITWRAGIAGQQAASRDERSGADRTELRSVLDAALTDLDNLGTTVGREVVAWEAPGISRATYEARHLATDKAYAQFGIDLDRLAIRLGNGSALWRTYNSAGGQTFAGSLYMYGHRASQSTINRMVRLLNEGVAAERRFRDEALRVAATRLQG
jgi:hypothetical protein